MAPIYWTKHFCLILSYKCSRKFAVRGQKLAIVERTFDNEVLDVGARYDHKWCKANRMPYRIDTRSKLIRRVIKIWPEVRRGGRNYSWRRRRLLGYTESREASRTHRGKIIQYREPYWVQGEAYVLLEKMERLWPLHCFAKEVNFEGFFQQSAKPAVAKPRRNTNKANQPSDAPEVQNSSDGSAEIAG